LVAAVFAGRPGLTAVTAAKDPSAGASPVPEDVTPAKVIEPAPALASGTSERAEFAAGAWRTAAYAGWSEADLKSLRDGIAKRLDDFRIGWLRDYGGTAAGRVSRRSDCFVAGWETGRRFSRYAGWALRVEFLEPGDITAEINSRGGALEQDAESETVTTAMVPVMMGFWTVGGNQEGASVRGFIFAGPAFGSMIDRMSHWFYSPGDEVGESWTATASASGIGYSVECGGELGYGMAGGITLFTGAAYRASRVDSMKYSSSVDFDGDGEPDVEKGGRVEDSGGDPLGFGFSGFQWTLGVRMAL
jgi:hypothetical protein